MRRKKASIGSEAAILDNRKLRTFVFSEYAKNKEITVSELARKATLYIAYDVNKLIKKEAKRQIRRIFIGVKDGHCLRRYLSVGAGRYVDIDTTESVNDLVQIKGRLKKRIVGTIKTYKKVEMREASLFDPVSIHAPRG